jgi:hypothetical protein
VRPTSAPFPVAPLNTYTFLKFMHTTADPALLHMTGGRDRQSRLGKVLPPAD